QEQITKKFAEFVKYAGKNYLDEKRIKTEKSKSSYSGMIWSALDYKGSWKVDYAQALYREASHVLDGLNSNTMDSSTAYSELITTINQTSDRSLYLDSISFSGKPGEVSSSLTTISDKITVEMENLERFKLSVEDYMLDQKSFFKDPTNI